MKAGFPNSKKNKAKRKEKLEGKKDEKTKKVKS